MLTKKKKKQHIYLIQRLNKIHSWIPPSSTPFHRPKKFSQLLIRFKEKERERKREICRLRIGIFVFFVRHSSTLTTVKAARFPWRLWEHGRFSHRRLYKRRELDDGKRLITAVWIHCRLDRYRSGFQHRFAYPHFRLVSNSSSALT